MRAISRSAVVLPARSGVARAFTGALFQYGRTPAYRRLSQWSSDYRGLLASQARDQPAFPCSSMQVAPALHSTLISNSPSHLFNKRSLHTRSSLSQQPKPKEEEYTEPPTEEPASRNAESESADSTAEGASEGSKSSEGEQTKEESHEHEGEQKEQKKEESPPPPHGNKSPYQVFMDTLRSEFKASKEWNESTKALASSAHEFTQNETLKKARSAYGAASDAATTTTAKAFKTTGRAIGQSAAWTWDTLPVKGLRATVNATGRGIEKATRPIRETSAYKSMSDVIDDGSSSKYGGWEDKEARKRKRETREIQQAARSGRPGKPVGPMEEDPEAGTNVTLHKDAAWKESWRNFRDSNPMMQSLFSLKSTYNESENPLISTARSISDRVAGFFAENETATVIKKFREMDPSFQIEPFLQDMREYVLPEVLDAYVKGEVETLKLWLSAAQFQVYSALMQQYTTAGLKSDGRILDIRHVDIMSARMLDPGDIPVFILTCRTQEVHVFRNTKTNELAAGMEDRVQQVTYAIGVTRIPEDVSNPETRGWRLIELQKSARDYM